MPPQVIRNSEALASVPMVDSRHGGKIALNNFQIMQALNPCKQTHGGAAYLFDSHCPFPTRNVPE
jgi:hypothetical protein